MKLYKYLLSIALITSMLLVSCEEDEDLLTFSEAENDISFPGNNDGDASFTNLDDVQIDVAVNGPASSLSVSGGGQTFGNVALSADGTGVFSSTLNDLGYVWTDSDGDPTNAFELSFSDGQTTRLFTIEVMDALTEVESSDVINLDSTESVSVSAATVNATIDTYEVYFKTGVNAAYSATPDLTETVNATEIDDSFSVTASNANYAIGDTIFINVVVNSGALSTESESSIVVSPVVLTEEGEVTLLTPDYEISDGVTDSLNNAFNFSALKVMADSVLMTSPDSADIRLTVGVGGELSLSAGAGSNTIFLLADEDFTLADANYESVRDSIAAGSPVTEVTDIESLNTNAVILVQIGNIPFDSRAAADNRRYAAIQINEVIKMDGGETSEVAFTYKAPAQPQE